MKLAISGKGGVGKTTLAAGLVRYFADRGFTVYAVDADPDASLGLALGLDPEALAGMLPIVEMREVIASLTGGEGAFFSLNPEVGSLIEQYSVAADNVRFLKMGTVKQGGTSCYCRENSVLHALLSHLLLRRDEVVILDFSAGIEPLTRGTARGVNLLLVVTEPTRVSLHTARTVTALARDLEIQHVAYVGNKVRSNEEEAFLREHLPSDALLGVLPFDEGEWARGRSLSEGTVAPSLRPALETIGNRILAAYAPPLSI
ncbi:MAG: AAA family ATPase [Clostridia bacterium]|nr:AAA family ATPase [Clostridia bacterium]MDH7572203.1 AAA family ATPase [Clostridia bacterium]